METNDRGVTAEVVLETLNKLRPTEGTSSWRGEISSFHPAVENALNQIGVKFNRHFPAQGFADFLIHSSPPILVECKVNGDWPDIACATWQVHHYIYHHPLENCLGVILLGSPALPDRVELSRWLEINHIRLIECCDR